MKDPREIIIGYFGNDNEPLWSLMRFLDTDTLVQWFVEEEYVETLDPKEKVVIQKHYQKHCY